MERDADRIAWEEMTAARLAVHVAKASKLTAEAEAALALGDVEKALEFARQASAAMDSGVYTPARLLILTVGHSVDVGHAFDRLMLMEERELESLAAGGAVPSLTLGYPVLDKRLVALGRTLLPDLPEERERREQAEKVSRERQARQVAVARNRQATEARRVDVQDQFSAWNGSHRGVVRYVKAAMNDPGSFDHVQTQYSDAGTHLIVSMTFRGKNAFGGIVTNTVRAKVSLDGHVLSLL